jgi:LacI family transcriptional regulator
VLLLVPVPLQFSRPFSIFWANELRKHLAEAGYQLEVHSGHAPYGPNLAQSLEVLIQQIRPAGCVLTSSNEKMQRWFSEHRVPCVIVGSRHPGVELASVDTAYRAACRHAVGQFLGRGHRRLAFLNPDSGAAGDLESEQGFNEGVARSNPADVQASVVRHDGTVPDICKKVDSLLRQPDPPTAFLVSRSGCVLTVMGHLMQSGVRLPQDAALISRDHDPFLEDMVPSVARYVVNPGVMAHRISRAVLELLQSGIVSPANCQILPEFKGGETFGRKAAMR